MAACAHSPLGERDRRLLRSIPAARSRTGNLELSLGAEHVASDGSGALPAEARRRRMPGSCPRTDGSRFRCRAAADSRPRARPWRMRADRERGVYLAKLILEYGCLVRLATRATRQKPMTRSGAILPRAAENAFAKLSSTATFARANFSNSVVEAMPVRFLACARSFFGILTPT